MQFVTYHSTNSNPAEAWVAYIVLNGEPLLVRCCGHTEAEAIQRCTDWYIAEDARQRQITGRVELSEDEVPSTPYKKHWADGPSSQAPKATDNDHGGIGKVWMLNHLTKQRARVNPNEIDNMIAQGYEKGGPKTAFRD